MIFFGIDNGTTGSIGIIYEDGTSLFFLPPVFLEQSYTVKKQKITRINQPKLFNILNEVIKNIDKTQIRVMLERPMINPVRFKASISAARCLESTLNILESLELSYQYLDSKKWQKLLLPSGTKGTAELKKASSDIGNRLFPKFKELYKKHGDADGILIAEYCRQFYK